MHQFQETLNVLEIVLNRLKIYFMDLMQMGTNNFSFLELQKHKSIDDTWVLQLTPEAISINFPPNSQVLKVNQFLHEYSSNLEQKSLYLIAHPL